MNLSTKSAHLKSRVLEIVWVLSGQAVSIFGALAGIRILAAVLQPAGFGELTLAITVTTFGQQILLRPLSNGGQRFFAASRETGSQQDLVASLFILFKKLVALLVISNAVFFLLIFQRWGFSLPLSTWIFATILSIVMGANSLIDGLQNAARHRKVVAFHQAGSQWLRFICAIACVTIYDTSSQMALLGYVLSSIVILGSQLFWLKRLLGIMPYSISISRETKQEQYQIIEYIWPFMTWGVFSWLQVSSNNWALACFVSTSAVGIYAVLYQFGFYPLVLITNAIQQFLQPILFQSVGDGTDLSRKRSAWLLLFKINLIVLATVLVTSCLAWIFHGELFYLLVSKEYRVVSYLLPPMILAGGLFACGQCASLGISMGVNTKPLIPVKIGTSLLGICLSFGCAFVGGLVGVVGAVLCVSTIYYLAVAYIVFRAACKDFQIKTDSTFREMAA
jgi:O-antigen/teichoic acid export membrane protein